MGKIIELKRVKNIKDAVGMVIAGIGISVITVPMAAAEISEVTFNPITDLINAVIPLFTSILNLIIAVMPLIFGMIFLYYLARLIGNIMKDMPRTRYGKQRKQK